MKLKPSLLQFIVIGMTISLLASCTRVPETTQSCNNLQAQSSYECNNSGSGSSGIYHGGSGYRYRSHKGSSSYSPSRVGRSGFGSFGRGASAGG
ncbi:hypothetical protein [Scytonema hofmannii]|uniref:hypothetical protein n=1 Tax=Scytonema hofmannii TaxID=34078 RepID=UPI000347D317|nr:hypothetical protein [Scytonema hofmannii]